VGSAHDSDLAQARTLCAGLQKGEIVLFDRGYHHLAHFRELTQRGVCFVTRPKTNLGLRVTRLLPRGTDPRILADEEVEPTSAVARRDYPGTLRRVTARVLVDSQPEVMAFFTNNFRWSAASVAELYRCRWQIEAFFKQIKQTLQLADFLGHSANAVQWQVWMALLVYVLLRCQAWCHDWAHSFSRLFTLLRSALWLRRDLTQLLRRYGTEPGNFAFLHPAAQSELPGFAR